jgi:serine/threonine protein kinase
MKKLHASKKLGEGSYGVVYLCNDEENKKYAVKRCWKPDIIVGYSCLSEMHFLIELGKEIKHPNIISLINTTFTKPFTEGKRRIKYEKKGDDVLDENLYHIMEVGEVNLMNYTLKDYTIKVYGKKDNDKKDKSLMDLNIDHIARFRHIKLIFIQLLLSLEFLHTRSMFHRDLSATNVILTFDENKNPIAKIIDFGLAGFYNSYDLSELGLVTVNYRAPEITVGSARYDQKVDIWALACVIYETITGKLLFDIKVDKTLKHVDNIIQKYPGNIDIKSLISMIEMGSNKIHKINVKKDKYYDIHSLFVPSYRISDFNATEGSYKDFCECIENMLHIDPNLRWSATKLLSSKFCQSYSSYINNAREMHPPSTRNLYLIRDDTGKIKGKEEDWITIIDITERKWGMNIFFEMFNKRKTLIWYKHATLFHAMALFDIYLSYRWEKVSHIRKEKDAVGKLGITKEMVELYARFCLYMYYKFELKLGDLVNIKEFFFEEREENNNEFSFTDKDIDMFIKFEKEMLTICEYKLYRITILEWFSIHYSDENKTEDYRALEIKTLIKGYSSVKDFNGAISELFEVVLKSI